ncbi:hypothetical protein MKX01_039992, partial [Papaver californicum]
MASVKHNLQELNIYIFLNQMIKLPDCLLTWKSLKKLKFSGGGRCLTGECHCLAMKVYSFPRLRYLALRGVSLLGDESLTSKLFSSCPLLESLVLTDCSIKFDFSSLSLKHFKLDNCDTYDSNDDHTTTVKLSAPNLTSLICKDYMSRDYSLENLSSLVTADIGMRVKGNGNDEDPTPEMPKNYSELATDLKELCSARMIKSVISESLDLLAGDPYFQFCNLRVLKVLTWVSRNCMNALLYLVKISPNIKYIFLRIEQ